MCNQWTLEMHPNCKYTWAQTCTTLGYREKWTVCTATQCKLTQHNWAARDGIKSTACCRGDCPGHMGPGSVICYSVKACHTKLGTTQRIHPWFTQVLTPSSYVTQVVTALTKDIPMQCCTVTWWRRMWAWNYTVWLKPGHCHSLAAHVVM